MSPQSTDDGIGDISSQAGTAGIQAVTTGTAETLLKTWDNDEHLDVVWVSELRVQVLWDPDNQHYEYFAVTDPDTDGKLQNWHGAPLAPSATTVWTAVTPDSGTVEGNTYFFGVFPFFNCPFWDAHAFHRTTINQAGNYQAEMFGEIEAYHATPLFTTTGWANWKGEDFETGSTYANNSRRDHEWYVANIPSDISRCLI